MVETHTVNDIVVDVPIRTVYNQWTQFEEFPKFMNAVEEVLQLDNRLVHFRVKIAGHVVEYDARILEQVPDQHIVWESIAGKETGGRVEFEALPGDKTRVSLLLKYAPEGVLEKLADLLGVVSMQSKTDLANFKQFIEARGVETGAWRGGIEETGNR